MENGICPHCYKSIEILDEYGDIPCHEEEIDCTCYECGENFKALVHIRISFLCTESS